jgi:hypothetical protein
MLNLAGTLKAQGDLAGARTLQEQVLEAMARLLGKEHRHKLDNVGLSVMSDQVDQRRSGAGFTSSDPT